MRKADGTLSDLTIALNEALIELSAPIAPADGTLASATSQINALLTWAGSSIPPADGTLADATRAYNSFVDDAGEIMAGLFDRLGTNDNVQVHYFVAGMKGYGTGIWTKAQVLSGINSLIVVPLGTAAQADLDAIVAVLDGKNDIGKLGYANQVEAAMIAAEVGVLGEAGWRAALEI